jgi:predicted ATPase
VLGPWGAEASHLPFAPTSFVGREDDLDALATLVREHRLVTITGSGGVGKTQTSLHVGAALSGEAGDVAWFVGLSAIRDPSLVVAAVASTLGVQQVANRPLLETLRARLRDKKWLLILDNCDHVATEAGSVAEALLASCRQLRILATSRQPLRAAGERIYSLPPLSILDAIELFGDRARAVDRRLALTDEDVVAIAEICRHLDGIPLAIELAAARVNALSLADLAFGLDDRLRILASGHRAVADPQKTLSAIIDWSYELLAPDERLLFARLGIFRGCFTWEAATSVCGGEGLEESDVFHLLGSLTEKALVVVDDGAEHAQYRLLESTSAYAVEKLSALGARQTLARRHATYFHDRVLYGRDLFDTESLAAWLTGIEVELDNVRAALEWTLTKGNAIPLGAAIAAQSRLWANAGLAAEGRHWIELALKRTNEASDPTIAADLRLALANLSSGKRKHDEGERALRLFESAGNARAAASAQRQVALALYQMRTLDEAGHAARRALEASRASGHARNAARCLDLLAFVEADRGDRRAARELHAEAIAAFRAVREETGTALALGNLAELEFAEGHPEKALRLVTESLEINLRGKNAMDIAMFCTNGAAYRIALGDFLGARELARKGVDFARQAQSGLNVAIGLQHLAAIGAYNGDTDRAARVLGYVDSEFGRLRYEREGTEQWSHDKLEAALRAALAEDRLAVLAAEGAGWSEDQALDEGRKL